MGSTSQPDEAPVHTWTDIERRAQITEFARVCAALADAFATHDLLAASEFRERAEYAEALLSRGFEQRDLNLLAGQFPDGAWWLNPKAPDYNAPREPWQDAVAQLHSRGRAVASDLRAIAVYEN